MLIEDIHKKQDKNDLITRAIIHSNFKPGNEISIKAITDICKVGYFSASRVYYDLIEFGFIDPVKKVYV